jgi:hypothetical protein
MLEPVTTKFCREMTSSSVGSFGALAASAATAAVETKTNSHAMRAGRDFMGGNGVG